MLTFQSYEWAIGSSPGLTDLQEFQHVGLNQSNKNTNLEGHLFDNQTYYVTVIARNGAGLETVSEFEGNNRKKKESSHLFKVSLCQIWIFYGNIIDTDVCNSFSSIF